jgi:hypothetical protein
MSQRLKELIRLAIL